MSLLNKLKPAQSWQPISRLNPAVAAPPATAPRSGRFSNGLKEFLSQLDGIGNGQLLDLGPVWQSTLSFFLERGYKIYSEDMLGAWRDFLRQEQQEATESLAKNAAPLDRSAATMAERFLAANLHHPAHSFDAVLLWDLLDYLDRDMATRFVERLSGLVRDGGALFAVFHTQKPEGFCRYRILDGLNFEMVPTSPLTASRQAYQNREIEDLFGRFRTSKAFVGRDRLREVVFVK